MRKEYKMRKWIFLISGIAFIMLSPLGGMADVLTCTIQIVVLMAILVTLAKREINILHNYNYMALSIITCLAMG